MKQNLPDLGDRWTPTILETTAESQTLKARLNPGPCQEFWIGGASYFDQNDTNTSGASYNLTNFRTFFAVLIKFTTPLLFLRNDKKEITFSTLGEYRMTISFNCPNVSIILRPRLRSTKLNHIICERMPGNIICVQIALK